MRVEMELRNLPRSRVLDYLAEADGQPAQVGSITVPRDLLVIEGKAAAVEPVYAHMRSRTMRGGG